MGAHVTRPENVEDDYSTAQTVGVMEDGHGMGSRKGAKGHTCGKNMRKAKSAASERSMATHGCQVCIYSSG